MPVYKAGESLVALEFFFVRDLPNGFDGHLIQLADGCTDNACVVLLFGIVNHMAKAQDIEIEAPGQLQDDIIDAINQAAVAFVCSWFRLMAKFHDNRFQGIPLSLCSSATLFSAGVASVSCRFFLCFCQMSINLEAPEKNKR